MEVHLARESSPYLSGPVSRSHQPGPGGGHPETNRLVRLAEAHADLALSHKQNCSESSLFCVLWRTSGGSTRAGPAQAGYVVMIADQALPQRKAAPMTLVAWRSHRVKRVVASASAAEAMGFVRGACPK